MTSSYGRDTSTSASSSSYSRSRPLASTNAKEPIVIPKEMNEGDENIDPYGKPPNVPVKPFPPRTVKDQPPSPFKLSYLKNETKESSILTTRNANALSSNVLLPSPRQINSTYITSLDLRGSMKESSYSTNAEAVSRGSRVSGVVTTANAISLQRAAARTRAAAEFVTITSPPSSSPQQQEQQQQRYFSQVIKPARISFEKGIGVTTRSSRRKSREGNRSSIASRLNAIAVPTNGVKGGDKGTLPDTLTPTPSRGDVSSFEKKTDHDLEFFANASRVSSTTPNGRPSQYVELMGSGAEDTLRSRSKGSPFPKVYLGQSAARMGNVPSVSSADRSTEKLTERPTSRASPSRSLEVSSRRHLSPTYTSIDIETSHNSASGSYDQSQPSRRYLSPAFSSNDIEPPNASTSGTSSLASSLELSKSSLGRSASISVKILEESVPESRSLPIRPRNASIASAASSMAARSAMLTAKEANIPFSNSQGLSKSSTTSSFSDRAMLEGGTCDKDVLLNQLLSSMALIDSQPYAALASIDEVESYKKELSKVEKRMTDVRHKLKVEMRVRDAADKLRRAGTRQIQHSRNTSSISVALGSSGGGIHNHQRGISIASMSAPAPAEVAQAEAEVASAIKRTDATNNELLCLKEKSMSLQKKLLEHQTRVLALRVSSLEEERARHLERVEEEEIINDQSRSHVAAEEVERLSEKYQQLKQALHQEQLIRDKVEEALHREQRSRNEVEKTLHREKRLREEEAARWRIRNDQGLNESVERLEAEKKSWYQMIEEEKKRSEATVQRMQRNHFQEVAKLKNAKEAAEETLKEHLSSHDPKEIKIAELQNHLEQAEFEMTAERKIMMERQKLFTAFERRLNRAEAKLREQDDRCARLLGKVDGREEMDSMLEQIKSGYGTVKKDEKTAGQDVDGLIDSIATHIGDLDDELQRRLRSPAMSNGAFTTQLNSTEQELRAWKAEAESAKRSLANYQRQSTLSVASNGGLSPYARSKQRSGSVHESKSPNSEAEMESRLALIEKQKESLQMELSEVKKMSRSSAFSSRSSRELELLTDAMYTLLSMLPNLDPSDMDLRAIQEEINSGGKQNHDALFDDIKEVCQEVMHRCRSLVMISSRVVDRTMANESKLEAFKSDLIVMESKCDDLRRAMEDMRRGNENHLEREKMLESTVNELRRSLTARNVNEFAGLGGSNNSDYSQSRDHMGVPAIMTRSRSSGSLQSFTNSAAPVVLIREPSSNSSFGTPASQRRTRGIPKPLSISTSNSNLSFTPASSMPTSVNQFTSRTMDTVATTPPPTMKKIATNTSSTCGRTPPRSMTLGMDPIQMRERIRQLEMDLIQQSKNNNLSSSASNHSRDLYDSGYRQHDEQQQNRDDLILELQEQKRELDYVKSVESRQRIDLLDELTNLTGELSEARAQLRAAQRNQPSR